MHLHRIFYCIKTGIFLTALLFSFFAKAQRPYIPFQHLSSMDGLAHNQILSILQDRQGFMWIGTLEGLNRYDGYEFTIYPHNKNDSASISDDFVSSIIEDRRGNLWVGTGAGLNLYNRATNSFQRYLHNPSDNKSISPGLINQIVEDRIGNLWLAFATGYVDYFTIATGEFMHYPITKSLVDVTCLQFDKKGDLWIGTQQGITIINPQHTITGKLIHDPANPASLINNTVNDIFQDRDGILWVATEGGLDEYDAVHHSFTHYTHNDRDQNTLSLNAIKCIEQDKQGRLWIGTINGGLNIWDRPKGRMYHFDENESDSRGINDNSIYCQFKDRNDNMWVGTNSSGINFYDCRGKPFVIYQNIPGVSASLSSNKVNAVAEQPGKGLWVATDGGGLNFFDEKRNLFKAYRHNAGDAQSLPGNYIVDVLWDSAEECLWVATWGAGLSRFDPETGTFKTFQHNADDSLSLASNNLWRIYQDREGTLYIGTLGHGMSVYDKKTSRFKNYGPDDGLAEENVVAMYRDSQDFLWLGSWGNGLTRIRIATGKPVPLPKGLTIKSNEWIGGDSLGGIWISGTPGIQRYDVKNNTVESLTAEDGLPRSNINAMLNDNRGNYWMSTNKGIVKFNVNKKQFSSFTKDDGLPTNQFSSRLLRTSNGKMYFGSVNGLVVFHPDSIKQNPSTPLLVITDLKVFNKSVFAGGKENILQKPISETKEIWLPYKYNFITLNYIAINNTLTPRNQYAYKLDGFNDDWVYVEHQRSATYTSLAPGDYTFKVKASNNEGLWNDEDTSLVIHVLPPWWGTFWFRTFAVLFSVLASVIFYQYRLRNIRNQNRKLNILVTERTRELEELNASKSAQNIILQERQNEIEVQNEELKQSKEEISAQWDVVMAQNEKLEEARATIERQNERTKLLNDNLEVEVQVRTRELIEYNKQLEQFAFISAHNLRAPVARILGLGNVLDLSTTHANDDNKMIYQKMVSTAHELDRVVRDLNTILEIRKNNNAFISEIDFAAELALVKLYIEKEIEDTKSVITADFAQAPVINSVKPYVESILQNLLSNAIKYRDPNRTPVIQITTALVEDYVCLTVTDNGLGIDTELVKEKVFKLYQRFHNHVEGKGLGLYLIKTQIDALGGRIELESKLSVGTTFRVYFKT